MRKSLAGTRIRAQRRKLGLTQKALATAAGISGSYLNLIEHNRRGVAGKVLLAIARALDVSPSELADGVESGLIAELREAAAHLPRQNPEISAIDDLSTRFPGWARLIATLYRQTRDQEGAIAALSDRLTHDPFLAQSLHSMLSNITAIRSTSNILKSIDDISPERQARFHVIIHEESRRLSDAAQALTSYFDHATDPQSTLATPEEALDSFLRRHDYRFGSIDALHGGQVDKIATEIEQILAADPGLAHHEPRLLAQQKLVDYAHDAQIMPLTTFTRMAKKLSYNPAALALAFDTDLHNVFRRLTHLDTKGDNVPEFGLVIVNASGRTLTRRPLVDFSLPRHGASCPLWPLFSALSQPGKLLSSTLELPGQKRFVSIAIASNQNPVEFSVPPRFHSAMLLIPQSFQSTFSTWLPAQAAPEPIGISCRICPRDTCSARFESQILAPET